jgi:hypothetical protein
MEGNDKIHTHADLNPRPENLYLLNMSLDWEEGRAGLSGGNKHHLILRRIEPRVVQFFNLFTGQSNLWEI